MSKDTRVRVEFFQNHRQNMPGQRRVRIGRPLVQPMRARLRSSASLSIATHRVTSRIRKVQEMPSHHATSSG
jgi:hypothetical protein